MDMPPSSSGASETITSRFTKSRRRILTASIAALSGMLPAGGYAASLAWDANGNGGPNPVDGGGTWNDTGLNWWNGTTHVAWSNSPDDIAIFGAGTNLPAGIAGSVTVSGALTVGGLVFNSYVGNGVRHSLNGGTSLTLAGEATITMNTSWERPFSAVNTVIAGNSGVTVQGSSESILEFGPQVNTYTGTVTLLGSTLSITSDSALGAASNNLVFGGDATLHARAADFTIANTRTITINNGVTATFDTLNSANRLTIDSVIGGGGSFRKDGLGSITLSRANTYTGETHIHQGTLLLNFMESAAGSQIINAASTLRLSGGTLEVYGGISANSQTFNGTIFDPGHSSIFVSSFGETVSVNLGAITRNAGSTFDWSPISVSTSINTTTGNVNGMLGGYATAFGTDWVSVGENGALETFVNYQMGNDPAAWTAADNVSLMGDPISSLGNVTINSLRTATETTLNISEGSTLTLSSGGILVTGGGLTISGGTIRGGAGADLIIHQYDPFSPTTIHSVIADNGGATALTKTGPGTLVLTGVNTYSGDTFLNAGAIEVNSGEALGTGSSVISRVGTRLQFGGTSAIVTDKDFLFDYGSDAYGASALTGGPNSPANFTVDVTNTAGVTISGAFNVTAGTLVKSGTGSLTLTNPGVNNLARINGGLAFTVSGGSITFDGGATSEWRVGQGEFTIGDNTPEASVVNIHSGTVSTGSWVSIGRGNGTTGLQSGLNITGGRLSTGHLYTGYFNNVSGYNTRPFINASGNAVIDVTDDFRMSESVGSLTTVNLSDNSTLNINDRLELGWGGRAVMNIKDNATVRVSSFGVGHGTNAVGNQGAGAIYQSGGSLSRSGVGGGGDWRIGGAMALAGTINMNDALVWGLYQISGGTLNTGAQNLQIGGNGRGVLDVRGSGVVDTNNGAGFIVVGRYAGSYGLLNVSETGTFNVNNGAQLLIVGEVGTATVNVSGNGLLKVNSNPGSAGTGGGTGGIRLGHSAGAKGTLNINGGTVQTSGFAESNASASSFLYLNGGTVLAGANNNTFMQGLDHAVVGPGGAIFDTNGNNITIGQSLNAPTGSGIATIEVTGGEGYLGQPIVEIVGDGSGASAVANVDPVTGKVTSITITNPGINYTSVPTINLLGGGYTVPATISAVALGAPVTTGGLTKNGSGTLTLSGNNTYTGLTTVNGGVLTIAGNNVAGGGVMIGAAGTLNLGNNGPTGTLAGPITVNGTLNFNRTDDLLFTDALSGSGTINKLNSNTLALNGATNFAGTLNVNGGRLLASGTFAGAVAVNNTGTLQPVTGIGNLSVASLHLGNGSTTDFEFNGSGTANDVINITATGGLSFGSAFTLNFYQEFSEIPFSQNGNYLLFDYTGGFSGDIANLIVGNPVSGKGYSLINDTSATAIRLVIVDAVVTSWDAAGGGLWTGAANWTNGVPNEASAEAVFGSAITSPSTVNIDGNKTVGKLLFDSPNGYTIGGSGTLDLDNGAASSIVMVAQGDHSITTPLNLLVNTSVNTAAGSSLKIGDVSGNRPLSIGGAGTVILNGNGSHTETLINGATLQVGDGGATGSLGSGPVTVTGTGILSFNRSGTFTIANAISGTGSLSYQGPGTMTYSGDAGYTGTTDLTGGTFINEGTINGTTALRVENTTVLRGSSTTNVAGSTIVGASTNASLSVQDTANAAFNGSITVGSGFGTSATLNLDSTGTVSAAGDISIAEGIGSSGTMRVNAGSLTQSAGGIFIGRGGAGAFEMTGGTIQTASAGFKLGDAAAGSNAVGTATISGGAISTTGEIWFGNNSSNSGTATIEGGSLSASNWIAVGRTYATGSVTLSSGSLNKTAGGGSIVLGSLGGVGTLTQSGTGTVTSANDFLIGENNGPNRSDGNKWDMSGGAATINGTLNVGWRSASGEFNLSGGNVSVGRLAIGSETNNADAGVAIGTVNITGGSLAISNNGESRIGGDAAVHAGSQGTLNIEGGSITVGGNFQVGAHGTGTMNMSAGTFTTSGWMALGRFATGDGTLNLTGGTLTHTNDSTAFLVAEDGVGLLNISGSAVMDVRDLRVGHTATAVATVNLDGGTLATRAVQKSNPGATSTFRFNGGVLKANSNNADFFVGFMESDISIEQGGAKLDTNGFSVRISQGLSGEGGLSKQGAGTLDLGGFSTYQGSTSVNAGTLLVSGSISGTTGVTVKNGGTLAGGGSIVTVNNGNVVLEEGASLAPGATFARWMTMSLGSGQLDLSGAVSGTGALRFGLGQFESDSLTLQTGVLNIGNGLNFDDFVFTDLGGFGQGTYILFDTGVSIVGTLGNVSGTIFGLPATIGFAGGASGREDLVLTVVPEPSAALAVLSAGSMLLGMRRRRR